MSNPISRAWTWLKQGASNTADRTIEWLENRANDVLRLIRLAFGSGTPAEQMGASALLATASFGASFITLGATIVLVAVFVATGLIGFARAFYRFSTYTLRGD